MLPSHTVTVTVTVFIERVFFGRLQMVTVGVTVTVENLLPVYGEG